MLYALYGTPITPPVLLQSYSTLPPILLQPSSIWRGTGGGLEEDPPSRVFTTTTAYTANSGPVMRTAKQNNQIKAIHKSTRTSKRHQRHSRYSSSAAFQLVNINGISAHHHV